MGLAHPTDDSLIDLSKASGDPLPRRWRYDLVFTVLILSVGALGVHLGMMARDRSDDAERIAMKQQRLSVKLEARRGGVFTRAAGTYVPLAVTRDQPLCFVDADMIADDELVPVCEKLGKALGLRGDQLVRKILDNRGKQGNQYLVLQRELTAAEAAAVRAVGHRGVGVDYEPRRDYPNGALAGSLVGYCKKDGHGGAGVEQTFQKTLEAEAGRQVMYADSRRRATMLVAEECKAPRDGSNVFLCVDTAIQKSLEKALAEAAETHRAMWVTGVVVAPSTGEVLAMSSTPTFDPNTYFVTDVSHFANRAISMPFEPGSVAKAIFAAMAVEAGVVTWDTKIFCENGVYHAPRGGTITDHGAKYGMLTVAEIVIYSSNIGMAKIGELMGNRRLHAGAEAFGLGAKTGIPLPGESVGILRYLRKWDGYSTRRVPFGQEISTTALQLAMAYGALVNGGELLEPRLVDYVQEPGGKVTYRSERKVVRRVISPANSARLLKVLQQVVENEHSTGRECRMAQHTSFGKTGTAQVPGPGGYIPGAFTGSFMGGAPVGNPRVLCLIAVYRPAKGHFGATVAAPYVKKVLEEAMVRFRVPPDKTVVMAGSSSGARGTPADTVRSPSPTRGSPRRP